MTKTTSTQVFTIDPNNSEATAKSLCMALINPLKSLMDQLDDPNDRIAFWFFLFGGLMGMSSAAMTPLATQAILTDLLKQHIQAEANGEFAVADEPANSPAH